MGREQREPLSYAPVSAVPVAGFVPVEAGYVFERRGGWYYQESDRKPMEYICPVEGHPHTGDFCRRDGCWWYRRDDAEPWEYVGPVDGRAVIL